MARCALALVRAGNAASPSARGRLVSRQLSRVIVEVLIVGAAHMGNTWTCPADLKILNISACETRYEISTNDRTNQP